MKTYEEYFDTILTAETIGGKMVYGGLLYETKALFCSARLLQCFGATFNEKELLQRWQEVTADAFRWFRYLSSRDEDRVRCIVNYWLDFKNTHKKDIVSVNGVEAYTRNIWNTIYDTADEFISQLAKYADGYHTAEPCEIQTDSEIDKPYLKLFKALKEKKMMGGSEKVFLSLLHRDKDEPKVKLKWMVTSKRSKTISKQSLVDLLSMMGLERKEIVALMPIFFGMGADRKNFADEGKSEYHTELKTMVEECRKP